jgi:autotransporter-associated beta strand protein
MQKSIQCPRLSVASCTALTLLTLLATSVIVAEARTVKDFFQNSDLTVPANYAPPGVPSGSDDVLLSSSAVVLTLNGSNLTMGSLNQVDNVSRTISNNEPSTANSTLTLGGGDGSNVVGGHVDDLIYVGCASCSLTLQGPNGGNGIGVLNLGTAQSGRLNVAQPNAILNIFSFLSVGSSTVLTKTGAGMLNFRGNQISGFNAALAVNGGTVNLLPQTTSSGLFLQVNNPNTAAGTAVTLNLYNSASFRGINGTIAGASSGQNSASVVLHGTATLLSLPFGTGQPAASYAGTISGDGSVSISNGTQTFAGNNTYTGTTTVPFGTLIINGQTSGQGNYSIGSSSSPSATLSGSGTIGLAADATITLAQFGGTLAPGLLSGIGTLHVNASGTGGVVFGDQSRFTVEIAGAGVSDLLAISGGSISLLSSSDRLVLVPRSGAFDGLDYTIATFAQNFGGGTFSTVEGLPAGYAVQYNATEIRLVALQVPLQLSGAVSRKTHGGAGAFDISLLVPEPVECRASDGNHTFTFTFTNYVTAGVATLVANKGAMVGAPIFAGKTMTINVTGVADVQTIAITLENVTDRFGQVLPNTTLTVNMLVGDTTGNRSVNASDVGQTKAASGFATTASNFRQDVTANGTVSASDLALVKARTGSSIAR